MGTEARGPRERSWSPLFELMAKNNWKKYAPLLFGLDFEVPGGPLSVFFYVGVSPKMLLFPLNVGPMR